MVGLFEFLVIGLIIMVIVVSARQAGGRSKEKRASTSRPTAPPVIEAPPTDTMGGSFSGSGGFKGFLQNSLSARVPRALLVVIRLVQGPMWISTGWYWVRADTTAEMTQQIGNVIESGRPYAFFLPFLEGTVLPWIPVFAFLVPMAELFVGLSLTFGAATRLGALVGMFLSFNYACLYGNPLLPIGGNWLYFFYLLPVLVGAAGRSFGADYWLHKRWPRLPIW